ncbi:hypothetical protein ADENT20671_2556 [Actinomyces denticolens]|uniref:DUF2752 domain-containing protein n=1 Tax=Actinomyces denticolens TaxID=52767 RepID=UPI0009D1A728|nr:DUF2752 domain-containing protein [Actinomyces denticolens]GAV95751.1 hypothetical protein ADENT20671_2556 [Actinomyces denticolens]
MTPSTTRTDALVSWEGRASSRRGITIAAAVAAASWALPGALVILGGALDPSHLSGMPDLCPTHRITGFWCPLCGGTRATAALLRGDLGTALAYNPFALATEVVAVLFVARWAVRRLVGRPGAFLTSAEAIGYGIACAGFLVLRNLPGMWEQLSPLLGPPG